MREFTTPTLNIRLKKKSGEIATDLEFEYLIFTLKNSKVRIDKRVEHSEVTEGTFKVHFTQEETGKLGSDYAKAMINFFSGTERLGTLIKNINLEENLINEVI